MYSSFDVENWRGRTKSDDYADSYAYYAGLKAAEEENSTQVRSNEEMALKAFWEDFNKRQNIAASISILYGLLQGWGMAGFALYLIKNAKLDEEAEWAIAGAVAVTVAFVNTWLVRPDLEKYIAFKEYEQLLADEKISKKAIILTLISAALYSGIVTYGISGSLETDDTRITAPVCAAIALSLLAAEGFLLIGALDKILKQGLNNKIDKLFNEYEKGSAAQSKAKFTFYSIIVASCIGMIGVALVGSKALANQVLGDTNPTNVACTSSFLLLCAMAQLPFYIDRAETLTRRWVTNTATDIEALLPQRESDAEVQAKKDKLIFNPDSRIQSGVQKYLWFGNALFNAPSAYLGVTTILGKCLGLQKVYGQLDADDHRTKFENQNTFEQIFFQYGNSTQATIVYSIAALFFVTAVLISLSANSTQPTKMADPKGEHEMKKLKLKAN